MARCNAWIGEKICEEKWREVPSSTIIRKCTMHKTCKIQSLRERFAAWVSKKGKAYGWQCYSLDETECVPVHGVGRLLGALQLHGVAGEQEEHDRLEVLHGLRGGVGLSVRTVLQLLGLGQEPGVLLRSAKRHTTLATALPHFASRPSREGIRGRVECQQWPAPVRQHWPYLSRIEETNHCRFLNQSFEYNLSSKLMF